MHCSAVTNAAVLHHEDSDIGLLCHCHVDLYSVCLVCRVLKDTYFRNTLHWLLPNIAYATGI